MLCLGVKCQLPAHCVCIVDGELTGRNLNRFRSSSNLSVLSSIFHSHSVVSTDSIRTASLGFHSVD